MRMTSIVLLLLLISLTVSAPLMLTHKQDLLTRLHASPLSLFFYGSPNSAEFDLFSSLIPPSGNLFPNLEFLFIPSHRFKMNRDEPSMMLWRQIAGGQWLEYRGEWIREEMDQWVRDNVGERLREMTVEEVESLFIEKKKGFIMLDFGQFDLLRAKNYVSDFCISHGLTCGKVTTTSFALSLIIQLFSSQNTPGISKLGYWNPQSQKLQIYTKELSKITRQQIQELYEGREGVIVSEGGHNQFDLQFVEIQQQFEPQL